ncbi:disease resistance protein At4g27190-like [Durio zibethinus]|uniref:Disease resistance protein At4g27190-like n=1 Tax=Durio zibethinus TaxID=66656 RepID=A0A6P5WXG1_DURZI|nr:disease resistance protein At4g27190-like [Durio zibethinus]
MQFVVAIVSSFVATIVSSFVAAIVGSFVATAAEYTISHIKNHIKYLSNHENQIQTLKNQAESLKDARERVQHSVDAAKRNGEEIYHDVDNWLTTVDKIAEEVKKVLQDEEKAKKKCFIGLCPNFWTRYKLSVKAEEKTKAVAELLEQRDKFDRVSFRAPLKCFEEFKSRMSVLNGIKEALKDDSIYVIGVHGMGGIGKTTLVKEIARQVKEGKLFDSVAIATVTQTLDVKGIQDQIADLLGLRFEEPSMEGRARRLRDSLKKEKKILVVLDDIWERLDLEEVGIPFGNEHEGCKILLTSRDFNVLSSGMDTQANFAVGLLNEEEAWDLFKKMAGDCVERNDLRTTAIEVANKCARLPIAIATVARALRNKDLFEWKNALRELKRPSSRNFKGVTADVYSAIKLSYNYLESEEVKLTFLLCSFLGHNGLIQDLLKYIIGLGLFHGVRTIEEARDSVLTVVSKLKASCLLLDSYNNERFDIHDVVWYVATSIARSDRCMFALINDDVLNVWPENEAMRNCSWINLLYPDISELGELPEEMECSLLSFFHMAHEGSVEIPANFFRRTERLKVLDLTGMHFPSLPLSIELLTHLHTLCLSQCALEDIAIVGKLKNLKILSLARSDIEVLPQEIAQLTQLRMLDLSHCTRLKIIPPNVLSSLSKLEELYLENSFAQWEDEVLGKDRRNASLGELNHLSHLTTFYALIPNAQVIPKHMFIRALDRYGILIGDEWERYNDYEYSRTLKFKLYTSIHRDHGVKILMNKTEDLHLDQLKGIKNVLAELNNGEDFPDLKKLHIQNGREVQYIATEKIKLSRLQSMTLEGLPQLINFCSQDKRCSTSQPEQGNTSSEPLPLFNTQVLICFVDYSIFQLWLLWIRQKKKKTLAFVHIFFVFSHLESVRLSSINAKRIWHSQLSETCYGVPNLKSLIIEGCDNLEYLLSPSIARSLVQLKHFKIEKCMCLRDVISTEEIEEEKEAVICFPRLDSLEIQNLHNLIKFCSGNYNIEFPDLKVLTIEHCPKLREFIYENKTEGNYQSSTQALFDEKAAVPSLKSMTISHLRNVKKIFHNELLAGSFCKLEEMAVENCDELLTVFSSTIVGVFSCLEKLKVQNCGSLQQIFEVGGLNIKETHAVHCQLRELYIFQLPKLKHVWNDPLGILAFQNLRKVDVWLCPSLINLFPASTAKDLPQLEILTVSFCGVEEIVSAGEGLENPLGFKFPQVSYLKLTHLNDLKWFCPGQHTTVWPMLKKLETDYSTLLKIVASERLSIQELNGNDQRESTIRQPLFLVEEGIPKLEELRLRKIDDIAMVCNGQFPADFSHQIRHFALHASRIGSASFPINFFQIFYNLEILEFWNCDLKNLVSCEGDVVEKPDGGTLLSRIRKLKLNYSRNLTHIWKKDSVLAHILPNLETLEVKGCDDLISFGSSPSSASFQNLTTLEVNWCNMMINLVTPSVALNLVQLTTMRITDCITMTEVVANEGSDGTTYNRIIFFSKLKYLELSRLQSLASFCPGNYAFEFPCLEELIVCGCPNLKIFSQGVLSTPRLRRVKESRYHHKGRWTSDLNITIQQLYSEKVGYHDIYHFKFSDAFPELMEIWNTNPQEIMAFKNLGRVEFCNCSSLKYIFTLAMALNLKQLYHLEVKECSTMEEVIVEQGVEEEPTTDKLTIFPSLWNIEIESCLNLTSFYLGS